MWWRCLPDRPIGEDHLAPAFHHRNLAILNSFSMVEPGEPRAYSQREFQDFSQKLLGVPRPGFTVHDDESREDPPFVRPVDYQCQFLVDDSNPRLKPSEKVCLTFLSDSYVFLGRAP